jgi:membrane fusion protein (multidrug efflux system)
MQRFIQILCLALALASCKKAPDTNAAASVPAVPLVVAPEDLVTVSDGAAGGGPVISGTLAAERKADLRAEASAVVLEVLKDNGDLVRRGDLLVRLDETAIRDNLNAAEDSAGNASFQWEQAKRNLERLKTLRASGMATLQSIDDAEIRANSAQNEVSAANSRVAQARQQLQRTQVRAPFDGVIGERKASPGDTASIGKELLKVIDPASLRFVGRVSADKAGQVQLGQSVRFRVNGYGDESFEGKVTRIDPSANEATRQIEVLVAFTGSARPRVAGLYAEGQINSGAKTQTVPVVDESAVQRAGDTSFVWRVDASAVHKVAVTLGARDVRSGRYAVQAGVQTGDRLLRNPGSSLKDGQAISLVAPPAPAKPGAAASGL